MKNFRQLLSIFSLLLIFSACTKDEDTQPENNRVLISEMKTARGITVSLWADEGNLLVAYNKLYISLSNSAGTPIKNAALSIVPVMDMTSMSHSCPAEQPVYNNSLGLYEGSVSFSMPSGSMGTWSLQVKVNDESLDFPLTVQAPPANTRYTGTYVGKDGISYSVSLLRPFNPRIGINDIAVLVNSRKDMMNFPPVTDLRMEINPEMPSMSHGSPNNVNPGHQQNGIYRGKVNFTMTGDWRIHFRLLRGTEVVVEDAIIDILF